MRTGRTSAPPTIGSTLPVAHAGEHEADGPGGERLAERPPDAAVGAGDEGGAAGEVHVRAYG